MATPIKPQPQRPKAPPFSAPEKLKHAAELIEERAAQRDMANGERSMGRAVAAFNALYGHNLTETEGWQFMVLLKQARAVAGTYNQDDYDDEIAYSALAAECEHRLQEKN